MILSPSLISSFLIGDSRTSICNSRALFTLVDMLDFDDRWYHVASEVITLFERYGEFLPRVASHFSHSILDDTRGMIERIRSD